MPSDRRVNPTLNRRYLNLIDPAVHGNHRGVAKSLLIQRLQTGGMSRSQCGCRQDCPN